MAKFFNQKVKKNKSNFTSIIVVCSIVGILLLIFVAVMASVFGGNKHSDAVVYLRDDAAIEVNNKDIDKTLFFEELKMLKKAILKSTIVKLILMKLVLMKLILQFIKRNIKLSFKL